MLIWLPTNTLPGARNEEEEEAESARERITNRISFYGILVGMNKSMWMHDSVAARFVYTRRKRLFGCFSHRSTRIRMANDGCVRFFPVLFGIHLASVKLLFCCGCRQICHCFCCNTTTAAAVTALSLQRAKHKPNTFVQLQRHQKLRRMSAFCLCVYPWKKHNTNAIRKSM